MTVLLSPEPVFLLADSLKLTQVLTNLLSNAAKFTDLGGHIRLIAETESDQIVLRVQDNGRGIPRDSLPRVFDAFWHDSGNGSRRARGLGLCLALVNSVVALHGGEVAAYSDGPSTGQSSSSACQAVLAASRTFADRSHHCFTLLCLIREGRSAVLEPRDAVKKEARPEGETQDG